jgi:hypothetical protein
MNIILTEEQLKRVEKLTKAGLNELAMSKGLKMRLNKSKARDLQNEFYGEFLIVDKLFYKFSQIANNINSKHYDSNTNTWENDSQKRKMALIYDELMNKLQNFGDKYLANQLEVQDMEEQIDTDDEEKELMAKWYGDEEEDEFDPFDDEIGKEDEFDYQYEPELGYDEDDSYELSREKNAQNKMNRSIRVGGAGAVDKETKTYQIDGKNYTLTPIEYRQMLKDMGRITPEKAANMGVEINSSGVVVDDFSGKKDKIKYLRKRISTIQDDIDRYEPVVQRGNADERLKWKVKYLYASLDTAMNELDELTGNVNGEEYDF